MKGHPKFDNDQRVRFTAAGKTLEGNIYIIDSYGTWDYDEDVSYDIMVDSENCLYKHIPEKYVEGIVEPSPMKIEYPEYEEHKKPVKEKSQEVLKSKEKEAPMTQEAFVTLCMAAAKGIQKRDELDKEFDDLLRKYGRCDFNGDCAYDLFGCAESTLIDTLIEVMNDENGEISDYIYCVLPFNEVDEEGMRNEFRVIYNELVG